MNKKLFQFFLLVVAFVGILFTSGCDEFCGGSPNEPVFEILYNAGGSVNRVYAVKDGVNLPPIEGAVGTNFYLPVDLNSTSVTYNFETTQGNNSLQVFYETNSNLESFDCGFRFSIENPRIGASTFNNLSDSGGGENYQITIQ